MIGYVDGLSPNNISTISAIKKTGIPDNLKNLSQYGIVMIATSEYIKTKTFAEIKNWLELVGEIKYAVDGLIVDDETLLIATSSINEINIINSPAEVVINIWTLPTGRRKGDYVELTPNPKDPPGTIYIRGTK